MDGLGRELNRAKRYEHKLSGIMLDVDHFKKINDNHGHRGGDRVLVEIGRILGAGLRESDLVGRYAGEEFVLLLPETDLEGAATVAERCRLGIAEQAMLFVIADG